MNAYTFFQNASKFQKLIDGIFVCRDRYYTFASKLGYNMNEINLFQVNGPGGRDGLCRAFQDWLNMGKSLEQFISILSEMKMIVLLDNLGIKSGVPQSGGSSGSSMSAEPSAAARSDYLTPSVSAHIASDPLAAAFESQQSVYTIGQFIANGVHNDWLLRICSAMNNNMTVLAAFLKNIGVLQNKDVADLFAHYSAAYTKDRSCNPALEILKRLCNSDSFSRKPVSKLEQWLLNVQDEELTIIVGQWRSFRESRKQDAQRDGENTFVAHKELRQWLLQNGVAQSEADVDKYVQLLANKDIEVYAVEDLRGFTQQDFRSAGFALRKAKTAAAAVSAFFCEKTVPHPPRYESE